MCPPGGESVVSPTPVIRDAPSLTAGHDVFIRASPGVVLGVAAGSFQLTGFGKNVSREVPENVSVKTEKTFCDNDSVITPPLPPRILVF